MRSIPLTADEAVAPCTGCGSGAELGFEITMAFQPIVERGTGAVFAQEALVRGPDGSGAASIFEQVHDGNRYLFDQACRTTAIRLASKLGLEQRLSINFMPNAVYEPNRCMQTALAVANETGFPIERLIFEIVESEEILEPGHLAHIVDEYRSMGMWTAMDDLGSGHAGLQRMIELDTDIHKTDRSLITGIDSDPRRQAVLRGLVQMSNDLGSRLIAEGIETREELLTVLSLGVELVQGYFIARPAFESFAELDADAVSILRSHHLTRA